MKKALSLFILLFSYLFVTSQANSDKPLLLSGNYSTDTAIVNRTLDRGRTHVIKGEFEEATTFISFGRQQARKASYVAAIIRSYNMEANMLCRNAKYAEALVCIDSALAVSERMKDSTNLSLSYMVMGNIHCYMGKYAKGMADYFKGLAIEEKSPTQQYAHWFYSNIGNLYSDQKNYTKALEYSYKAVKAEEKRNDKQALLNTFSNMGQIFSSLNKMDSALYYYNRSLKISQGTNDEFGISLSLVNIATLYTKLKQYDKAMDYSLKASKITKSKFVDLYVSSLINLGHIYKELKNYPLAESYFTESLTFAKKINSTILIKESSFQLASLYEMQNDYKKSYDYFRLYSETKDSLLNQENSKLITEMNTKYTTEKKEKEIELLKKNEAIQNLELSKRKNELKNQRTISLGVFSGFMLLMIVAILTYSRYRLKKKANTQLEHAFKLIEEKNTVIEKSNVMITDSIVYAKRIQDAILPATEDLHKILSEEFFILYKPAQIVSGDFYWCSRQNNKTIFVVADCTGHGVPGAFMSMIGNTLLNEIVNEQKITDTKEIAEHLDKKIILALKQHSDSTQYDGMDITICSIDKANNELHFTGAHHSMYCICNGTLTKLKGDPFSIGGAQQQSTKTFTSQKIILEENVKLYFSTDGYYDQSGGTNNRRFGSKKFEKLIEEIHDLTAHHQQVQLENIFEEWKGSTKQRDDVLVVGIRAL